MQNSILSDLASIARWVSSSAVLPPGRKLCYEEISDTLKNVLSCADRGLNYHTYQPSSIRMARDGSGCSLSIDPVYAYFDTLSFHAASCAGSEDVEEDICEIADDYGSDSSAQIAVKMMQILLKKYENSSGYTGYDQYDKASVAAFAWRDGQQLHQQAIRTGTTIDRSAFRSFDIVLDASVIIIRRTVDENDYWGHQKDDKVDSAVAAALDSIMPSLESLGVKLAYWNDGTNSCKTLTCMIVRLRDAAK